MRAHPNLFSLVLTRPAVTTTNLDLMESVLQRLESAGFGLGRGLDVLYSVTGFVVGQASLDPVEADVQVGELAAAGLEGHPLLAEAARDSAAQQVDRFDYALDAMLAGFEGMVD